ncbi:MalY/PatB family protein [Microbacter margulisiae]|uniref:cysteine-S-conjugate beta-lyase n=1 Tax=Microbacter margulisiae TaxID=1350067 RepID=A0A7W5DPG5_9PORP|nr:PatB family C-S lyase [Microbacter margulisiae]MBB3186338.1 cystathionine beta-lyase [Microbacter margulisiae]
MDYNFDERIDRRGTNSVKYDLCRTLFGTDDIIPMWVADMDFRTPDFIIESLGKRCEHPVFGYTILPSSLLDAFCAWTQKRYSWEVHPSDVDFVPGIVTGINLAIQTFTKPGDKIIVQPPVYPPFFNAPKMNGRHVVWNSLKEVDGRFEMDFDALEKQIDNRTTMLILSNPHNPGGRVWSRETLQKLASLCYQKGVLIVSDEIHADMTYNTATHVPFSTVSGEAACNSIVFMSPSKAFNIPGIIGSFIVAPDKNLYRRFHNTLMQLDLHGNLFAYEAMQAAYHDGEEWLNQMIAYIQSNAGMVVSYFTKELPAVKAMMPESSFLVWIDFSELNLSDQALKQLLVEKAGIGLNEGISFGPGGAGHQRMNIGTPRSIVSEALQRISHAVKEG